MSEPEKAGYGWTIEVHAEDRYTALYEIDQINDYLQGRYVNGQTRSGIPQNKTEAREDSKTGVHMSFQSDSLQELFLETDMRTPQSSLLEGRR
jgi:hypothetical protein